MRTARIPPPEVGHLCCAVAKIPSFFCFQPPARESPSASRRSVASLVLTAARRQNPRSSSWRPGCAERVGRRRCWGGGGDSCVVNGNCGLPASVTVTDEPPPPSHHPPPLTPPHPHQTATTNVAVPLNRPQSSSFLHSLRHSARRLPRSDDRRACPRSQLSFVCNHIKFVFVALFCLDDTVSRLFCMQTCASGP